MICLVGGNHEIGQGMGCFNAQSVDLKRALIFVIVAVGCVSHGLLVRSA